MNKIQYHGHFLLQKWLLITVFFCLSACSEPVVIRQPLDVSKASQIATAQFTVKNTGNYLFALMFVTGSTFDVREQQFAIFGDTNEEGVPIDMHLRVLRDGVAVLDQDVRTVGTYWGQVFIRDERRLNTAVRLIRILELSPGTYTIEARTLSDVDSFKGIESYVEFSYYNPKH
ncbi:DUF5625 family protein [Pseudomonas mosselii]|uniref:DUF5625 family protein n=1 Tax=Pseudomonas mosselii TaxID=78327 RepID=A0AA42RX91_9PSED|nr:DUF5625 family protein [Pseudomonas mosselii]MDH1630276.1 DUF5625 family protein [Pseudomonas mosselii]MEA3234454.1 DUF5625 family protein [Pseudomonas mosselii]UWS67271.1 DUF5625 family protein [Pseudomonas mosselii]